MATQDTVNNTQIAGEETPWYQNKWVLVAGGTLLGAAAGYGVSKLVGGEVIEVIADTVVDGFSAVGDIAGNALI